MFEHAGKNHGLVTRGEAIALGMSKSTLARRVADGALITLGPGIYATPGVKSSEETMLLAATHSLNGVASHRVGSASPRYRWLHRTASSGVGADQTQ